MCVSGGVGFNGYTIISRAVEEGVAYGYRRAHKHDDKPSEDHILDEIERAVMNELCDVLQFGNNECGCECCGRANE
jgi:hypothetical protein